MAKLYPPIISGIIPAFAGTTIVVPFSMNKGVSRSEVGGYALKLKTTNNLIKIISSEGVQIDDNHIAFTIDTDQLKTSNGKNGYGYYKIQLAYVDKNDQIGFYSTVGVVKYTAIPSAVINNLKLGQSNSHTYDYTMTYTNTGDPTEKMYQYKFKVTAADGKIIKETEYQLHNSTNDDNAAQAVELFHLNRDIPFGETYYIQGYGITSNDYEFHTPRYKIIQKKSIDPDVKFTLTASLDYDNGVVNIGVDECNSETIGGLYLLSRCDVADGYNWEELKRLDLHSVKVKEFKVIDFTPMQGVTYQYSLQQYNDNHIYSERIKTQPIYVDFEDMFLFDGKKQLCVRFNPKVATYKRDLQENKVETIGSKYPYIMRNGNVNYKEFSIAGLISYQMDGDNFYMDVTPTLDSTEFRTDLVGANFAAERTFKNDILDWLNDGKVKLFRSPAEGNYIVRLMNVSMSPNDTLGRMLHSFTCVAYELDEVTNETLQRYGIVDSSESISLQTLFASVDITAMTTSGQSGWQSLLKDNRIADSVFFIDMIPGTRVRITVRGAEPEIIVIGATGSYRFASEAGIIEASVEIEENYTTGIFTYSYKAKASSTFGQISDFENEEVPIHQFIGLSWREPKTDYQVTTVSTAGTYVVADYENGNVEKTCKSGEMIITANTYTPDDIIQIINNSYRKVSPIYYIKATKRDVRALYLPYDADLSLLQDITNFYGTIENGYAFYWDKDCTQPVESLNNLEEIYLYELRLQFLGSDLRMEYYENGQLDYSAFPNAFYYIDANINKFTPPIGYYIDGCCHYNYITREISLQRTFVLSDLAEYHDLIEDDLHIFSFDLNGENIDLTETGKYFNNDINITSIIPHAGVTIEIGYTAQNIAFVLDNNILNKRLQVYLYNRNVYNNYEYFKQYEPTKIKLWGFDRPTQNIGTQNASSKEMVRLQLEYTYNQYITALSCALANWSKEQGNVET